MRTIRRIGKFRRDYKRIKKNPKHSKTVDVLLEEALGLLVNDQTLPMYYRDHGLSGYWRGFRDCHLKPDLVLIYRQTSDGCELQLAPIGSHSELF